MGGHQSVSGLTRELLEDYATLTYLSKGEILYLLKKFHEIEPEKMKDNFHHRISRTKILNKFPVLQINPFRDRLFAVFSSQQDGRLSFEDLLDLCSAMSPECPAEVKAAWAFRVYDIDGDKRISEEDIKDIISRLTQHGHSHHDQRTVLDDEEKKKIANMIIDEVCLVSRHAIEIQEFKILVSRIPEFQSSFYFTL